MQSFFEIKWKLLEKLARQDCGKVECYEKIQKSVKILKSQCQETKYPVHNYILGWIAVQSLIEIEWKLLEKLARQDSRKIECDENFQTSVKNFKITESGNKIHGAQLHVGVPV